MVKPCRIWRNQIQIYIWRKGKSLKMVSSLTMRSPQSRENYWSCFWSFSRCSIQTPKTQQNLLQFHPKQNIQRLSSHFSLSYIFQTKADYSSKGNKRCLLIHICFFKVVLVLDSFSELLETRDIVLICFLACFKLNSEAVTLLSVTSSKH